jgi:hypothetical protein
LDSDQVFIQNRRAAVNSVAQRQQRVRTQSARAALRFDNGAVARLAHNSSLMVGQCAQLNRGTLLVNGSLNGCSTTTMAGVRGTIYTLEVTEEGETVVKVFEGEVVVGQRTDADAPDGPVEPEDDLLDVEPGGATKQTAVPTAQPDNASTPAAESPGHTDHSGDSGDSESPFGIEIDLRPADPNDPSAEPPEAVEFNPDTVLVINEGQQVIINAENDAAIISLLTAEDFINLLEGPLIQGFSVDIPGMSDLQRVFRRRFPPIPTAPGLPSIIIPLPPIQYPF